MLLTKSLNLGFGRGILKRIISDEDLLNKTSGVIDSERIFILDLEEWDILISHLKREKISLVEMLDKILVEESNIRRKFISMHLTEIFGYNETKLDYLDKEFENLFNRIIHSM